MLKGASVCQQCHYGQTILNKPGLSKIVEIASIVLALSAVLFAWQQAASAAHSLAQSEKLSVEFDKQEQNLALLDKNTADVRTDADDLSLIVAESLSVIFQNTMAKLATDKNLLDLLCPNDLTAVSLRLDCDIRHVDFSVNAVNTLVWLTKLSPAVAENSDIDKLDAIATICGYQPGNINELFDTGDYVMGLENFVPFQNISEIPIQNPEDLPTEGERQQALGGGVIALYKNVSKKWANAGTSAYENLENLCS